MAAAETSENEILCCLPLLCRKAILGHLDEPILTIPSGWSPSMLLPCRLTHFALSPSKEVLRTCGLGRPARKVRPLFKLFMDTSDGQNSNGSTS